VVSKLNSLVQKKQIQNQNHKINTKTYIKSTMHKHKTLVFTSFLFFITCLFGIFHTRYRLLTKMEEILFLSILIQTLLSVLFWTNPHPRFSLRHRIDAIFVKINAIAFSICLLFLKSMHPFFRFTAGFFFISTLFCFYQSDKYSRQSWCCESHIFWHACSHLLAAIGISHTFL
jgi:hypothetical protein